MLILASNLIAEYDHGPLVNDVLIPNHVNPVKLMVSVFWLQRPGFVINNPTDSDWKLYPQAATGGMLSLASLEMWTSASNPQPVGGFQRVFQGV